MNGEIMSVTQTQVSALYVAMLNRAADGDGNRYWQEKPSMESVTKFLLDHVEEDLTNKEYVEMMYQNALNKTPGSDTDGVKYWTDRLDDGESREDLTPSFVRMALSLGSRGEAQDHFINRIEVSDYMAENLRNIPASEGDLYFTTEGEGLLVTGDRATVESAKALIDTLST